MPQDAGLPDPSGPLPAPHPRSRGPIAGRIDAPPRPTPPAASAPPALSAAPDLMGLLLALRHRWVSAVLLGGTLGAIASVAMWFLLTPKNVAFAQIKVAYYEPGMWPDRNAGNPGDFKTYLQTTAGEIMSRRVIAGALNRDEVKRLHLTFGDQNPSQAVSEDLRVEFKENSELLTIFYTHAEATAATTVANAVMEAFMEDIVYAKRNERARKVTELEKIYGEAVESLKTKKDNLKKVAQNLGTTDPHLWREQRLELVTTLRDAKQQHVQIGFKLVEARAALDTFDLRLKALKKAPAADPTAGPAPEEEDAAAAYDQALSQAHDADAESRQLRDRIDQYGEILADYERKGFRSDYIGIVKTREKMESYRRQLARRHETIASRVKQAVAARKKPTVATPAGPAYVEDPAVIRGGLLKQVEALTALEEKMRQDIKDLSGQASKTPVLAAEYEQLADEIHRDEKIVEEIGGRLERERIELRAASRISRFQNAEMMRKDTKKQLLAAGASPLAIFFAVCMGLSWLEFRKRRVRSAGEISRGLGIRVVGAIPRVPHLERQLVPPAGESELEGTPVMESIDAIRTRLLHEATTRSTRVVMVTSAGAGEGKTTLASALATSLARAGRRTLLLDADLRSPTVHELFDLPMQPGFSEVLLGEIEVTEAARESMQDNLSIIPAGQWDREVLAALARDGLEGLFEKLADEFDFIILDSHPVLTANDSLLIGRQVDAVLLSVLREVSQMPRVFAAQQQLSGLGVRILGAVISGTDPEEAFAAPAHASVG